jgi:hypothetical protein
MLKIQLALITFLVHWSENEMNDLTTAFFLFYLNTHANNAVFHTKDVYVS